MVGGGGRSGSGAYGDHRQVFAFAGQPRREAYRRMVAAGELPAGYASEDGVGLHYVGTELRRAVTIRPGARAWWVEPDGAGGHRERPVDAVPL